MAFLQCCRATLVDIGGKIDQVHATLCLLARLDLDDRQGDIAAERLEWYNMRRDENEASV